MIQLNGFCIVSDMPDEIHRDEQNRLHCETKAAIHFRDGYEQYYWHGISIPSKWITNKNELTKDDYNNEQNAEKRRCFVEIIGNKKLIEILDLVELDKDIDNAGNKMRLLSTREVDIIAQKKLYFYECICPSTGRQYHLRVPECKNVWEAFKWGFNNKAIEIRHGDVGLLNLKQEFSKPIFES